MLTGAANDALLLAVSRKACCRRSELAVLLRFAIIPGLPDFPDALEAEFPSRGTALRCATLVRVLYGYDVRILGRNDRPRGIRWRVRVECPGLLLAKQVGIVTTAGVPVVGLPAFILAGQRCDAAAAWRAALLMAGGMPIPIRSAAVTVKCSGEELGMALVAAARRIDVRAVSKVLSDGVRVDVRSVRDGVALLGAVGGVSAVEEWVARSSRSAVSPLPGVSIEGFESANALRVSRAAALVILRLEDALRVLGDAIPPHLRAAAELRIAFPDESLKMLGARAVPPLSKDAIAGRLRRLLDTAELKAGQPVGRDVRG